MIDVKYLDQTASTKISLNSNLASNEQRGVGLIFLGNIYIRDETSSDMNGSQTEIFARCRHLYLSEVSVSLLHFLFSTLVPNSNISLQEAN